MNKTNFFMLIILFFSLVVKADFKAEIFEKGSNRKKQLYTIENQIVEKDGFSESTTVYKDLEGNTVVIEKAKLKGSELITYEVDQKQTGAFGKVTVDGDKVKFEKISNKETESEVEKKQKTLVCSASFQKFVKENWAQILKGEDVEFRYVAWERKETVGFEIFKIKEEKIGDQKVISIKMKPSSFIISALVDPLVLKFEADGSHLLELNGRVSPKKKVDNSWKDLDAEVVYHHQP